MVVLELLQWLGRVYSPESCDVGCEAVLLDLGAACVSMKSTPSGHAIIPPLETGVVVLVGVPAIGWRTGKKQVGVRGLLVQSGFEVGDVGLGSSSSAS